MGMQSLVVVAAIFLLGQLGTHLVDRAMKPSERPTWLVADLFAFLAAFVLVQTDPVQGWLMKQPSAFAATLVIAGGALVLGASHLIARRFSDSAHAGAAIEPHRLPPMVIDYEIPAKAPTDFSEQGSLVFLYLRPTGGADEAVTLWSRTAEGVGAKGGIQYGKPESPFQWYTAIVRNTTGAMLLDTHLVYRAAFFAQGPNQGAPVARREFSVDIPILEPGQKYTFYVTNASDLAIAVDAPTVVLAKVAVEDQPREVGVIRSQDSMWGSGLPQLLLTRPLPAKPAKDIP